MAKATRPLDCVRYENRGNGLMYDVSEHVMTMLMNDDDCFAKEAELDGGRGIETKYHAYSGDSHCTTERVL